MSEDLITKENVSKELLKLVFDGAYLDSEIDSDGSLFVKGDVLVYFFLSQDSDRVQMVTSFKVNEKATTEAILTAVNDMNMNYAIIKCWLTPRRSLRIAYDLMFGTGITRKTLVTALIRFMAIPRRAIADYGKGVVD